jgi:hypothetical protein
MVISCRRITLKFLVFLWLMTVIEIYHVAWQWWNDCSWSALLVSLVPNNNLQKIAVNCQFVLGRRSLFQRVAASDGLPQPCAMFYQNLFRCSGMPETALNSVLH